MGAALKLFLKLMNSKPMMVEVLGDLYGFTWSYDPPSDGEWGAVQESGNMSGLIGQAGAVCCPHGLMCPDYLFPSLWFCGLGDVWRHGDS